MMRIVRNISMLLLMSVPAWAGPTVSDAWIPEAPPVSTVMAGYMTIHNPAGEDLKIVSVQSGQFDEVQIHLSIEERGVAKMLPQKMLIVPAKDSLQLKPGSFHLMMFGPVSPLKAGDKVAMTLNFSDGSKLPVVAEVKKAADLKAGHEKMKMKMDGSHRCY